MPEFRLIILFLLFLSSLLVSGQSETIKNDIDPINTGWKIRNENDSLWITDVNFPNTIHEILFEKKIISDPYFGKNEKELKWIEESNWIAEKEWFVPALAKEKRNCLHFQNIEPFSEVYINNILVAKSESSFLPLTIELNKHVNYGQKNSLKIIFKSSVIETKKLAQKNKVKLPGDERVYVRKPQYEFGWDWGPRFVTIGIKKTIQYLSTTSSCTINQIIYTIVSLNEEKAIIEANAELHSFSQEKVNLVLSAENYSNVSYKKTVKLTPGINKINFRFTIEQPQLWWPVNYGLHPSYQLRLELKKRKKTISVKNTVLPLCTTELVRENDSIGQSFSFKVNGVKIFAKGYNVIPEDHFNTKQKASTIAEDIALSNGNIARVWGGGYAFDNGFYESCVENGILIWQDFYFACAMYPGDSNFFTNVKKEIDYESKRLANYKNIALWCGNNENDEGWKNWGWQKQYEYSAQDSSEIYSNYIQLFDQIIPQTLRSSVPNATYIPSSPQYGWGRKQSMTHGDSHYWGVWWGVQPIEAFNEKIPRFMSEYGMQSMPELSTFNKCIDPSKINFESDEFKNHQKHPTGYETINYYLKNYLMIPSTMDEYSYITQVLQAITLKSAIEAQRSKNYRCSGSLIWQLNDSWPVTSWSVVDYYKNKKLAYHEVSRCFNPLLITFHETKDSLLVRIINDNTEGKTSRLSIKLMDFYGKIIFENTIDVDIKEQSNHVYYSIDKKQFSSFPPYKIFFHASLEEFASSVHYLVPIKELKLPAPNFEVNFSKKENGYTEIELYSKVLVPFIKFNNSTFLKNEAELNDFSNLTHPNYLFPQQKITLTIKDNLFADKEKFIEWFEENLQCLNLFLR